MKKQLSLFLACLSLIAPSLIADCCCCNSPCRYVNCFGFDSILTFDIGGGYRNTSLNWKVFPEDIPGRVVEEKWRNIGLGIVEANAQFLVCEHYLFKADFDFGWFTNSGSQRFDSFGGLNVGPHAFKSRPKGNACDLMGGLGYQFNFDCFRVSFAPLVGYSYHQQRLKSRTYENLLFTLDPDLLAHNDYKFRWSGPWVGFALAYQATCELQLYVDYYFHWARFRGTVKEHFPFTRVFFPNQLRSNRVYGNQVTVGGIYTFCDYWYIGIKFDYKQFCGNKGRSRIERDDFKSPLRSLDWKASTVTMDIGYQF